MTYNELAAALKRTGIPFEEGAWWRAHTMKGDYGAYAVDGRNDLKSDGTSSEKMLEGTVDLFTRGSNGLRQAAIVEDAMDSVGAAWEVSMAANYEETTGLTHWEWVFHCLP